MTNNPRTSHPSYQACILAALLLAMLLSACQPAVPQFTREPQSDLARPSQTPPATASVAPGTPAQVAQPSATPGAQDTPQPETAQPTPTLASPLGVDPADLAGVEISFWHNWSGPALKILHGLVDTFNASNEWGIQVNATYQGNLDELYAKTEALEAAARPDILAVYLPRAIAWDESQGLVDLNAYVDDPLWGMSVDEQASFYPALWEQDRYEGRRLGLPAQRFASLLYYNQTWGGELGFANPPTTPDEFREQACAAAATKLQDDNLQNDALGGWIISTEHPAMLSWLDAFGSNILASGDSQGTYNFDTRQTEAAFTFLRQLYDRGCAWISANQPPEAEFAARDGLLAVGSLSDLPYQAAAFQRQGSRDEWTVLPFPSPSGEPTVDVYGPSFAVTPSTPEKQLAAWLFLKWLLQPENQARLVAASGALPLSAPAREALQDYAAANPQWAAAVELLAAARSEPGLPSWDLVRWALSDAATQLFREYFTIDRVPDLARLLDQTADDLAISPLTDRFLGSGAVTPTP
jgi:multiple sugar transport system substrate-binding protein